MTEGTMEHSEGTGGMSARGVARLAWALCALALLVLAFSLLLIVLGWSTPLSGALTPWRDHAVSVVAVVVASALIVSIFLSALSLMVRYRRASGVKRQQLRWLAGAAVLVGVVSETMQLAHVPLWLRHFSDVGRRGESPR